MGKPLSSSRKSLYAKLSRNDRSFILLERYSTESVEWAQISRVHGICTRTYSRFGGKVFKAALIGFVRSLRFEIYFSTTGALAKVWPPNLKDLHI